MNKHRRYIKPHECTFIRSSDRSNRKNPRTCGRCGATMMVVPSEQMEHPDMAATVAKHFDMALAT